MDITYREVKVFRGLRESGKSWYTQRLENYDKNIGREGEDGCNHEEWSSQEDLLLYLALGYGQRQDDSR